jgi:CRISPR-associated exonuclease Cas4
MNKFDLTGTLINSYVVCRRKAWLNSRKISPNKSNCFISMGSSLNKNRITQKRIGNIELDEIEKGKHIIVKEYKKTFSNIEASKMQLLFYMMNLKEDMNLKKIDGYIISEETNEKLFLPFNSENEEKINGVIDEILIALNDNRIPKFTRTKLCDYCGHNMYCL